MRGIFYPKDSNKGTKKGDSQSCESPLITIVCYSIPVEMSTENLPQASDLWYDKIYLY